MPRRLLAPLLWLCLLPLMTAGHGVARAACAHPVALLISAEGTVSRRGSANGPWSAAAAGAALCEGDTLRTSRNSRAALRFTTAHTLIRLDQETTLRIIAPRPGTADGHLDLVEGAARFFSRVRRRLDIDTPFANALVDGTELLVRVRPEQTRVDLFEGSVLVANALGELRLRPGQGASARRGEAPRLYRLLDPDDAAQWAISYQPMLAALLWGATDASDTGLLARLRNAHRLLLDGHAAAAFAELDRVPPRLRDANFHNARAALLLTVGRVQEARADLAAARRLAPGDGDAAAIESVIALGVNDTGRALTLAHAATGTSPARPLPWLALSYAEQATFDLPAARGAMDRALATDPANGVLRARLAELLLALGELRAARTAAEQAVSQAPHSALAHRAQGFAALLRIDLRAARAAFRQALALDPADPVAHLGLGLTAIRAGRLVEGRVQLETAVALDPLQSLLRTYLGKAYYDERRNALAATSFEIASELDPNDPTPWLYRAVQLRAENRPVEALDALETSLGLNDYRAQFRTPATLAADEAARTAAVGQIYRDLGFDQLALVQGFRAVTEAPDDQSGHRLLADVYSALPRHEEARVSELLQAQLLQPLTRTPVLPLQGETRLLTTDTLGPSTLGLGEYGPLFERNGLSGWIAVLGGTGETFGDQILASALIDKVAFSIGQYHLNTEGSGGMRKQDQDIGVGFVQAQLSPRTSVQAELRHTDTDEGPYLDQAVYTTLDHTGSDSARLGLTHRWSPRSVTIASLIRRRFDQANEYQGQADPFTREVFAGQAAVDGWTAELRHDWRSDSLSWSLGTSLFDDDTRMKLDYEADTDDGAYLTRFHQTSDYTFDLRLASVWLYGTLHPSPRLDLTLGLSWSSLQWNERRADTSSLELLDPDYGRVPLPLDPWTLDTAPRRVATRSETPRESINPKLGITWRPFAGTSLRAAAFRTLRGPDAMKQTIEPTQLAGFNQLFDGYIGEDAWRYGIGIDQRISNSVHIGVEASRREVSIPNVEPGAGLVWSDRRERFLRAYAAVTPSPRLALSAQYFFEENVLRQDTPAEDRTHRLPLTLSYFDPNGLFGSLRGTYVQQSANPVYSSEAVRDSFWGLDLSIGFRLPKRRGLVVLAIDNILDAEIRYRETDPNRPLFVAERVLSLHTTLQF